MSARVEPSAAGWGGPYAWRAGQPCGPGAKYNPHRYGLCVRWLCVRWRRTEVDTLSLLNHRQRRLHQRRAHAHGVFVTGQRACQHPSRQQSALPAPPVCGWMNNAPMREQRARTLLLARDEFPQLGLHQRRVLVPVAAFHPLGVGPATLQLLPGVVLHRACVRFLLEHPTTIFKAARVTRRGHTRSRRRGRRGKVSPGARPHQAGAHRPQPPARQEGRLLVGQRSRWGSARTGRVGEAGQWPYAPGQCDQANLVPSR